ncbi:amidohydrolase [Methanococcus vannielii SB]|uniref:5'-deoxyadenosine deaminase n=1 Tax=Methanococcus vannielii (strain ATCC 35089 / DSM 1224 / JCM 13029 / OCM 148 / SB) TaxID=406327 RepID=DADD_METVS|nr:amidohydrolase [Methanococcus vannielii]A6UQD4.1 RecName: Full=5'-deoxyadenosine deaminase; Short=5'-dA deaminase; AltName: Full=5'-methylthioadenosine deaminase; Short=MTA deaminase; AltName: Full=Adenosine deaminase; AltName: Full=S-adenosylhomocysteine deaminase; Short=SAH deaminase [Methanococcus vannielii SB]ABR54706.1 amidohydrolase [Methanococcus vannielii SB]
MILVKDAIINGKKQDLLVEGNIIKKIGNVPISEVSKDETEIIDGKNCILIPGLVNTHTHIPMSLFRGVADDIPLMEWLSGHIWPMESKLNEKIVYAGTLLGAVEMIKSGTTAFNDMYFFLDSIIKAVDETGIRSTIAYGMIDLFNEEKREKELKSAKKSIEMIKKLNNSRITGALGPHAPYTCSKELLESTNALAREYNVPIHIHMNETVDEINQVLEKTKMRPFEYLNSFGFFDNVTTVCAHCVHLNDSEIKIIKEKNIFVAHNPISNLKLASGVSPVAKLLENEVNITLGTDGCGSNNSLNLFEEMKTAALIHKGVNLNPVLVTAKEAFEFGTLNGAKALNINSGEIKEGKLADFALINVKKPYLTPRENIESHLVYSFNGAVDSVVIDGKLTLKDGKMVTIDEEKVYELAEEAYLELTK